ncbi:LacI family DNA-binding transcriptional regulator [Aurantiacibacter poecillastricola]|uniref:LacI family DNA-binding transcriptional regulator n=1 Tax=Aurantiacibacter poecillastricola TaxID=3064385 RepID=UPI00273FD2C9|nr:LacI family DNA-binding transcriptional regulator [Aurantiacibacter sp. 219JJ12-13]MDP5262931.1 LacI family DNA-binding transcriptional regulator [Aurantiacibacter sp. 219JJ12-13]
MAKVTIKDIAKHAGVSFKTVSRVINRNPSVAGDLRAKVEASMTALDYKPNRAASLLRGGKSYTIGLILGPLTGFIEPDSNRSVPTYITDVITGLLQACNRAGYHLLIEPVTIDQLEAGVEAIDALLEDTTLDGLVLVPPLCDRLWLVDHLVNKKVPCVRINPGKMHERTISIGFDNDAAGVEVADYILRHNHRRIGYISGPPNHGSHDLRWQGFARTLEKHPDVELRAVGGDFAFDSGWSAAASLLGDDEWRPTAIFAANDEMAAGVIAYAQSTGLAIPGDLSVIGFGDLAVASQCWPRLTTVRQPTIDICRDAGGELINAVANRDLVEGKVVNHPYRFIQRDSIAAI